jgi:hypothetical protein
VLQVEVELSDPDWAELRDQGRTLADLCSSESPYEYFTATVTVDGMRFENVEVRKKGFFGSLSSARPSLKLRFAEDAGPVWARAHDAQQRQPGPEPPAHVPGLPRDGRTGVPAPRCNHARVSVNGEDLGVFTHVDSMNKPFLRLYFEDEDGALFEGQLGDFTAPYLGGIQSKTEEQLDREFLADLQAALERPDQGDMLSGVSARVDVDAFLSFWAAEALVGQWDGYSNNRNNWFAYRDPINSKLYFMPWGPDAAFAPLRQNQGLGSINGPLRSVFTTGRLARASSRCPASGGATKLACSTCWTPPGTKTRCSPRWRVSRRCWAPTWRPSRRPRCRTTSARACGHRGRARRWAPRAAGPPAWTRPSACSPPPT